jgi:protein NRD1
MVAPPAPAPAVLTAPAPATPDTGALLAALAVNLGQQNGQTNLAPAVPTAAPYPNIAPPHPGYMAPSPVATNAHATQPAMQVTNELIQQILQAMASGVLPADQGLAVLAAMAQSQQSGGAPAMAAQAQPPMVANAPLPSVHTTAQNGAHPDRYEDKTSRFRDRSRSPEYQPRRQSPNRRSPPHRRESPTYGVYDPNAGSDGNITHGNDRDRGRGRGRNRGRGRDRDEYRQRSPPVQRRQASPDAHDRRNSQPKFIEWDQSLPRDHIKVLSRTLFVGGAGGTEQEIRNIFSSFGKVQTCIVNQDKRHAFVKMVNREDAISAKNGMDNIQDPNALAKARQVREERSCNMSQTNPHADPLGCRLWSPRLQ